MEVKYKTSLFYQINLSAKYFTKLFDQVFEKINIGITATEHLVLGIIMDTKDCCQRDLAKLIFKDRANTGKLATHLEEMGLITIKLQTKNNRPVKILSVTKKGKELYQKAYAVAFPIIENIYKTFSKEKIDNLIFNLKEFRLVVENSVKTNI